MHRGTGVLGQGFATFSAHPASTSDAMSERKIVGGRTSTT
jgi:hypothetical protein